MIGEYFDRDYTMLAGNGFTLGDMESSRLKYVDPNTAPTLPHVLIDGSRQRFDECLRLMNRYAAQKCGTIHAHFNMETHIANIQVTVSDLVFSEFEDIDLLSYISRCAKSVYVIYENQKQILSVAVNCFTLVPTADNP